jgi:nitronate monooxygenase
MNFGGGATKAWRDIWGAGQGVGQVHEIVPAAERIAEWQRQYGAARRRLALSNS